MRLKIFALIILLATATYVFGAGEPYVGFVCHYPFVDKGMDKLPKSGVTALITRAPMSVIEPKEGKFDFSCLDKEIIYAEKHNLKLCLLLECNPVYSPGWANEKCKAAGEMKKFADGSDATTPSIYSPIFAKARDEFIGKVIEYVKQRDTKGVITCYNPGAEWWFEHLTRYSPLDIVQYRSWLQKHYGDINIINERRGTAYKSFDEIPVPKIDLADFGHMDGLSPTISMGKRVQDCSWSTRQGLAPKVIPGKTYIFSAWVKTDKVTGRGAHLSTSWLPKGSSVPFHMDYSKGIQETKTWQKIAFTIKAPKNADRAWLLLKLAGFGTATFDDAAFYEVGTKKNLLANPAIDKGGKSPDKWFFDNWLQDKDNTGSYLKTGGRNNSPCVQISIPQPDTDPNTIEYQNASMYDWAMFWQEAGAKYINDFAGLIKQLDPTRSTVSYLTYAFAFPVEWDYVTANAIAIDEVGIQGSNLGIIGMQIPSADGDPFRITASLDTARKYGPAPWAIDLLDFTSGVAIGYSKMNKITQTTVQHGARGIFYYCWNGTPDYDFYPGMKITELNSMLTDARTAIKLTRGLRVKPRVALIEPILPVSVGDKEGFKNDYRSFYGWYKILENMHQTFDIVTFRDLQERKVDLREYKWILIPDCAYIPKQAYLQLVRYTGSGRNIVTSGRFAEFDEIGRPTIEKSDLFMSSATVLPDYGKAYAGKMYRDTRAGNTPALFLWRKETPQTKKTFETAKASLQKFFNAKDIKPEFTLTPDDPTVSAVIFRNPSSQAIYLVNTGDKPVKGAKLHVPCLMPGEPVVYTDLKETKCASKVGEDFVDVVLPEFKTTCIVRMMQ